MKRKLFFISLISLFIVLHIDAQPIIYRPGPGLNDGTDQGGINGGKDTWVNEAEPGTNYGTHIGLLAYPTSNCNETKVNTYIKFDLTSLPEAVDSVLFGVDHYEHTNYCLSHCDANFYFAYVLDDWNEMTVNYTSLPGKGQDFLGPVNIVFPNSFGKREYNITNAYNNWKSGAVSNNGFIIHSPSVGCNNACVYFLVKSSDDTTSLARPYLKIYEGTTAIQNKVNSNNFSLYPNPSSNHLVIRLAGQDRKVWVSISDTKGRVMHKTVSTGTQQIEINTSDFADGIYLVKTQTDRFIETKRLIISK